jgi:hypothetical protein
LHGQELAPPIFIVGVPRSGTTLLAAMLGAHPRLICGPETHFFTHLFPAVARRIRHRADWPGAALDYVYSIHHVGESIPANYGLTREELAEEMAPREPSVPSALAAMIELYMRRNGKRRWIEKTPDHLPYVGRIRGYYPDSPIIRIIRDPRDVATSLQKVDWGPGSLLSALSVWRGYDERSTRFFERDRRCHTVRYEDLVRDPEPSLREVCRAIDEPFDPVMLDTTRSAHQVNAAAESCKTNVARGVDTSRVEAWRNELPEDDLRLVEAYLGDRLRAYGYPVLGFEVPHPVEVHALGLLAQDPDMAASLVARGARFWAHPGERPELALFLGDPNEWLSGGRLTRLRIAARLAGAVARHRLRGVPIEWIYTAGRATIRGIGARALSRLLPDPAASLRVPELAGWGGAALREVPAGDGGPREGSARESHGEAARPGAPAAHADGR